MRLRARLRDSLCARCRSLPIRRTCSGVLTCRSFTAQDCKKKSITGNTTTASMPAREPTSSSATLCDSFRVWQWSREMNARRWLFTGGAIHDDHGKMAASMAEHNDCLRIPRRKRADRLGCRIASISRQLRRHGWLSAAAVGQQGTGVQQKIRRGPGNYLDPGGLAEYSSPARG